MRAEPIDEILVAHDPDLSFLLRLALFVHAQDPGDPLHA